MNYHIIWFLCATFSVAPSSYSQRYKDTNPLSVDFTVSMKHHRLKHAPVPPVDQGNLAKWNTLKELYEKNCPENITPHDVPRIPKVIHQIWLGSPFPEKYRRYQKTWLKHHPDWKYKLWTDKDIQKMGLYNQAAYDAAENYGERADIARYEILYRYGGLYVDTDFECLAAFDAFHHRYTFYTGVMRMGEIELNNALIGAAPGHLLLKHCIERISNTHRIDPVTQTIKRTGPAHFSACFFYYLEHNSHADIVALPISFFYPLPVRIATYTHRHQIAEWISPSSYAVHYWANSWTHGHGIVHKGKIDE
jgi:mannosyltransferase OCH1-like enzyme